MGFLLDDEDEVPSERIRDLVSFAAQADGVSMENSFFYWHLDYFLLANYLSSEAGFAFAPFWKNLSFSLTGIAVLLDLLVHSRSHLVHLRYKKDT